MAGTPDGACAAPTTEGVIWRRRPSKCDELVLLFESSDVICLAVSLQTALLSLWAYA